MPTDIRQRAQERFLAAAVDFLKADDLVRTPALSVTNCPGYSEPNWSEGDSGVTACWFTEGLPVEEWCDVCTAWKAAKAKRRDGYRLRGLAKSRMRTWLKRMEAGR